MRQSERIAIRALLAVDQASVSGVAMGMLPPDGRLRGIRTGTATDATHRVRMTKHALAIAGCTCFTSRAAELEYPMPCHCGAVRALAVVLEDHSGIPAGKGVSTTTLLGMGAARGRWEETLDHFGHPDSMRFRVDMPTWRGVILGQRFAHARREVVKAEAVRWAQARTQRTDVGDDEAEALCILTWAGDAIPQKLAAARRQRDLFDQHGLEARRE